MTVINLTSATYNPKGIITIAWDRARFPGSLGFVAQLRYQQPSGFRNFVIHDPQAVSCLLPYEFVHGRIYTIRMFALDAQDQGIDSSGSNTLNIPNPV